MQSQGPLSSVRILYVGFRNMEFGHNGFYLKDDDTDKTTLTGEVYHCGPLQVVFTKHWDR